MNKVLVEYEKHPQTLSILRQDEIQKSIYHGRAVMSIEVITRRTDPSLTSIGCSLGKEKSICHTRTW